MVKDVEIYQYVGYPASATSVVSMYDVWVVDVPTMGEYYHSFLPYGRTGSYPRYSSGRLPEVTVTVRVYISGGDVERVTMDIYADGIRMVSGMDLTDEQPEGTLHEALTYGCDLAGTPELEYVRTDQEVVKRLPLAINGIDFSEAAERLSYSIGYEDRVGASAVTMLNGDEYPDVLARRPVITWPLNMLWAEELRRLYRALGDRNSYVPVRYYDTRAAKEITGEFRGTLSATTIGLNNARGAAFRDGAVLTLRAR